MSPTSRPPDAGSGAVPSGAGPGPIADPDSGPVTTHPAPGVARTVLPGGLRVVTEHVAGARSASVGLWIDVGSRDEPGWRPAAHGAAHFLEHLLFKGTTRRSARRIAEEVDAVGGDLNAFTGKEHTCFYAHVLDRDMRLAVDVLCDVVLDAVMDPADVEIERDVVLAEIAGRDEDPEDLLADDFDALLFAGRSLGLPVIGTEHSVGDMTRGLLADFHAAHYTPDRAVLTVAGNVEHAAVLDAARAGFGDRLDPRREAWRRRGDGATGPTAGALEVREDDTEQAHLMLGVPGLAREDPRWESQLLLSTVLGGGVSSRLFQEVRERRGLAYSVYAAPTGYTGTGSLAVAVACAPERLGTTAGVLDGELAALARDGVTDAELTRARGQLRGELLLGLEETAARMGRLGRRELDGSGSHDVAEALERIAGVTVGDVADLAAELLAAPRTTAVVGPYADVDDLPEDLRTAAGR